MEFDDKKFNDIFGDFFDNWKPMTEEEILRKREEEKKRQEESAKQHQQFLDYARTLPGAEKESEDNPIIQIKGKVEDGRLEERAVTMKDALDELFSDMFSEKKDNSKQSGSKQYKR